MFIIAEGFDNSGKTTLLTKLSKELSIPVTHSPGHGIDLRESLSQIIEDSKNQDMLRDRICLVSEEVYGKILRGKSEFDSDSNTWWLSLIKAQKPILIFCRPPTENIIGDMTGREQMEGVITHSRSLLRRYDEVFTYLKQEYGDSLNLLTYDYTQDPEATQILDDIRRINQ